MNKAPIETARDADLRLSGQALRRAAQKAHELAERTGTALVVNHGRPAKLEPKAPTAKPLAGADPANAQRLIAG